LPKRSRSLSRAPLTEVGETIAGVALRRMVLVDRRIGVLVLCHGCVGELWVRRYGGHHIRYFFSFLFFSFLLIVRWYIVGG
jgi:hypothetical protein